MAGAFREPFVYEEPPSRTVLIELPPQRRTLMTLSPEDRYDRHFCALPYTYFLIYYKVESIFSHSSTPGQNWPTPSKRMMICFLGMRIFFRKEPYRMPGDPLSIFWMSNVDESMVCLGESLPLFTTFHTHRQMIEKVLSAFFSSVFESDVCCIPFNDGEVIRSFSKWAEWSNIEPYIWEEFCYTHHSTRLDGFTVKACVKRSSVYHGMQMR